MAEGFGLSKRMLIVVVVLVVVAILFLVQNGKKGNAQPGGASSSGGGCQVQVTADVLNVRAGPETTAKTLTPLHNGQTVSATATTKNGFRELSAGHWASSAFLKPVSGSC